MGVWGGETKDIPVGPDALDGNPWAATSHDCADRPEVDYSVLQ